MCTYAMWEVHKLLYSRRISVLCKNTSNKKKQLFLALSLSYFHSSSRRIADCCKGNSPLRLFLRGVPVSCPIATGMSRNNNGQEILVMLQSASRTQRVRCAEAILGLSHLRKPSPSGFIDGDGRPRAHSGEYSIPINDRIADCIALLQTSPRPFGRACYARWRSHCCWLILHFLTHGVRIIVG